MKDKIEEFKALPREEKINALVERVFCFIKEKPGELIQYYFTKKEFWRVTGSTIEELAKNIIDKQTNFKAKTWPETTDNEIDEIIDFYFE